MGCRCNERRDAIINGMKAAVSGDLKALADQARVFSKTVTSDLKDQHARLKARVLPAKHLPQQ
jgi:hypothetical protein